MPKSKMPIAVSNGQRRMGEELATWRRILRLTAAQVADRAGLSRHTVMRLENGAGASLESVLKISPVSVTGISISPRTKNARP